MYPPDFKRMVKQEKSGLLQQKKSFFLKFLIYENKNRLINLQSALLIQFTMYQPKKYKKEDKNFIFRFIKSHPFATFVLQGNRMLATHIPVLTEGNAEQFGLFGHIANNNEQAHFLKNGTEALLIFQGSHAYISSSWYKEKDISTWDYSAVHINVRLRLQSERELENSLQKLVAHFEKDQEKPLYYKDIPEQMLKEHLPLITGFWCEPVKIEAIAKLHQGYGKEDVISACSHLDAQNDQNAACLSNDIKKTQ